MPPDRLADDERRQRGEASWREVMVKAPPKPISPYIAQGILDFVFSEMWTRPGLTRKERRFITLACVAAAGQAVPVKAHVKAALESGDLSLDEMKEFILHFAVYSGWPLASSVEGAMWEAARELGLLEAGEADDYLERQGKA
jgi:4-carboxymuconolactone decarboxylase